MFKEIRITRRFFICYACAILVTAGGFVRKDLVWLSEFVFWGMGILSLADALMVFLFIKKPKYEKKYQERLSLGDENTLSVTLTNTSGFTFKYVLYEGFPTEMAERKLFFADKIKPQESVTHTYIYTPKKRGVFSFGDTYLLVHSLFGFIERRFIYDHANPIHVYPSVIQMKKYELMLFQQSKVQSGIKRIRRIGMTKEFEQIRNYVQGDEIKSINWKATSRKNELMVNQYQEEKAQNIYCIVDKGRVMQMQSDGLTMLDYSINSALVLANICLIKSDKVGLFTFSHKLGASLVAENKKTQLKKIMDLLYNQQTFFRDSNYELLQQHVNDKVKNRSLLLLFTNFENHFTLKRALPYLLQMKKKNLLVLVMFINEDLQHFANLPPKNADSFYKGLVAGKMITDKQKMAKQLNAMGIQTILTHPSELSANVINKYLALKAKGVL